MNKLQIVIIVFSIIIAIVGVIVFSQYKQPGGQIVGELSVWGIESPDVYRDTFRTYEDSQSIKIIYTQKDEKTFSEEIINALAERRGPDLVVTNNEWITEHLEKLSSAAATVANIQNLRSVFVESAADALFEINTDPVSKKTAGVIWGLPLWFDPLVLFWNKDIFDAASIALPPKNWFEFLDDANKIKKVAPGGVIVRAGTALGRSKTIPLYKELLGLLLLQQNTSIDSFLTSSGNTSETVLRFYTDFGRFGATAYTWNNNQASPRDLFVSGKLGMMIDYASFAPRLVEKNAHLSYGVAPAPQPQGAEFPIHSGSVKSIAVTREAKNADTAWAFAKWLGGKDAVEMLVERYPAIPARRDLLDDPNLSQVAKEATLNARYVGDSYPRESSFIIGEMLESIADGKVTPSGALIEARQKFEFMTRKRPQ